MVTIADLDAIIAKFLSRGFNDIVASTDHNDVCDAIRVIRDLLAGAGGGVQVKVVDYDGDGTFDRIIGVGFSAKFYAVFERQDWYRKFENVVGFDSDGYSLMVDGGAPISIAESFVTDNGINVGRIFWQQGGGNANGTPYRLIAYS